MKLKSLFAVEVISTAFTYKILNEILENSWIEILEISSATNAKNLLLFQADDFQKLNLLKHRIEDKYGQPSRRILEIFNPQLYDLCLLQEPHAEILPSFVALEQNPVDEALVVFESQSICAVLSALQLALEVYALKICDVKLARQSGGMNCVFLTGAKNTCEQAGEALAQQLFSKYLIGHVEVITSPETKLREFFGFAKGL